MVNINDKNFQNLKRNFICINKKSSDFDFSDGKAWFKEHRTGTTGIGKTFEDLLGKKEDNLQLPDFEGIEIKAHNYNGSSMITLFTKTPNLPKNAANSLRESYGYVTDGSGIKVLHISVPSNKCIYNSKSKHYFKIVNNKKEETIDLKVYNSDKELQNKVQAKWSYEAIKKSINKKLKQLAIVLTDVKNVNGKNYFNYNKIIVASISIDTILSALNDGKLCVDLRLGAYKSGKNKGKYHDHGTGFRITLDNLKKYVEFETLVDYND